MLITDEDKKEIDKFVKKQFKKLILKQCAAQLDGLMGNSEKMDKALEKSGIRDVVELALKAEMELRLRGEER